MAERIPLVDYLVLGDEPHIVAQECVRCSARFFDRRNACASCSGMEFRAVDLPREGTVYTFSIVSLAPPGVPVPFVAAVVDCGGTKVRGVLVNIEPRPENVTLGMKVRLATVPLGADTTGVEAVGYGFEPV
ncbi:Zn-ribbon domain-containing OB-fold protein [Parafrankia elaeagni]|uniref:Zn-ribbon domain-containing OB-fold protein n=1 Tax=Parafrankia elaeagni TaxID=222534 RepID=UPI00047712BB|nr:OB-fold domain-containing protein [Parafrankia elaeagni]